ncbi:hypothetical protein NPIL_125851 [Nephila pilipes]|uniref:Uncharacterized protein n=1 Tax=Nephila pilipes TaxID=299642 RepID=A0A8X6PHM3_NEPPI|nr:hypothetical protein NPIL_125851 [Nephila pilipes]
MFGFSIMRHQSISEIFSLLEFFVVRVWRMRRAAMCWLRWRVLRVLRRFFAWCTSRRECLNVSGMLLYRKYAQASGAGKRRRPRAAAGECRAFGAGAGMFTQRLYA